MYEGRIIGSNIGCISSYTLEVMILYLLIHHYDELTTPIDVFLKFFEYDWFEYVVTVQGLINLEEAQSNPELVQKFSDVNGIGKVPSTTLLQRHFDLLIDHQGIFQELNESYNTL